MKSRSILAKYSPGSEKRYELSYRMVSALFLTFVIEVFSYNILLTAQASTQIEDADSTELSVSRQAGLSLSPSSIIPSLNQNFISHGQVSSSLSVLPDRNDTQTAVILIPRGDGGSYSGILTYHSTRPVEPVVWNVVSLTNSTSIIPDEFGEADEAILSLLDLNSGRTAQVVLSTLQNAATSGSVLFSGDAIELVGEGGEIDEPFIVSYSLTAFPSIPTIVNDLESISNFTAAATAATSESEDVNEDSDN